jgi:endoplasmic reticulum junction formation protein lunapark
MESMQPSKVVGHYRGSGTSDNGWITKVAALPVGEDPSQSYVLICGIMVRMQSLNVLGVN